MLKPSSAMITVSPLRILFISHGYVVGVNQGKFNASAQTGKAEVGLPAPSNWKALEWNRLLPLETPYPNIKTYSAPVLFTGRGGAHLYAPWKPALNLGREVAFTQKTYQLYRYISQSFLNFLRSNKY